MVSWAQYRRRVLTLPMDERLTVILAGQIERWGQDLRGLEVPPDHGLLLVGCAPPVQDALAGEAAQAHSSLALRGAFPALNRRLL
jgi:hypothetical protein